MTVNITKEQARKFLIHKQLLTEKPKQKYAGIEHVFNKLRIVQYDPLNPCGRNPDLVFQSRVENYHPNDYHKWLYEEKKGIECYDKVLCIIPIEDFPLTSHNRKEVAEWPQFKQLLKDKQKDFEELLKFIDKKGPISSADIENQEIVPSMGWYGYGSRWGKVALELLWKTGRIVISKRVKGTKYYDLPHKVYDGDYFGVDKAVEEEHILRRIASVGILRATGATDAWRGLGSAKHKSEIIKKLLKDEILTQVTINDVKNKYLIHTKDIPLFDKDIEFLDQMKFIAPLDTLIWDRGMIEDFFGFKYKWEVYNPAPQRKYGYYVLPILYKDQFVGRIEPLLQNNALIIKNIWKEKNTIWTPEMDKKLTEAIERFKNYLEAKTIDYPKLSDMS